MECFQGKPDATQQNFQFGIHLQVLILLQVGPSLRPNSKWRHSNLIIRYHTSSPTLMLLSWSFVIPWFFSSNPASSCHTKSISTESMERMHRCPSSLEELKWILMFDRNQLQENRTSDFKFPYNRHRNRQCSAPWHPHRQCCCRRSLAFSRTCLWVALEKAP